jgi:alkanesulfonate monooxygenase SsuD/methylene tetrahydromethanopterin reductase-like flavin-dependent oxidoreductase (luciferase family)
MADAIGLVTAAARAIGGVRFRLTRPTPASLGEALADAKVTDACAALAERLILHVKTDDDDESDVAEAVAVLESCRRRFTGSAGPEVNVEGQSAEAAFIAIKQADRLWRRPARPTMVDGDARPVLHFGTQVGLVTSMVARETTSEALAAAAVLFPDADFASDTSWAAHCVWVNDRATALVGSFDELAGTIERYERAGISSFLIRGWGVQDIDDREMAIIGSRVLPLLRRGD